MALRLYKKEELLSLLKSVGFKILETEEKVANEGIHAKKNIIVIVNK